MIPRRHFCLGTAALLVAPRIHASPWPARPIRLIVPFAIGGPTDLAARMVAEALGRPLGQPIVVENRPGAGGNIGAEAAALAAPDGYTLFWAQSATHGINPTLYDKLPYDPLRDFASVALLVSEPLVIVAHPRFGADDAASLIDLARRRPGQVRFGSGGAGSTPHMAGELFASMSKAALQHVPYKGNAPAVADVMAGHIDIVFDGVNSSSGHIRAGKLKALGITGRTRSALLPGVAPISDTLAGYEVTSWGGIVVPAHTPQPIVDRLSSALAQASESPGTPEHFAQSGLALQHEPPARMDAFVRQQIERWRPLVLQSAANAAQ